MLLNKNKTDGFVILFSKEAWFMVTVVLQQIKYCKICLQYKGCLFE